MKKILIIGCPGAGKSTFARALRDKTGLPLHYLDQIYHRPDRTTLSREAFDERLGEVLAEEEWIIDGNYQRTMERRMAACDTVFFLDYPVEVCLAGAQARVGKRHEDLPWIEDILDPEFKQWILDFAERGRPHVCHLIEKYREGREIVVFRAREDAEGYLNSL